MVEYEKPVSWVGSLDIFGLVQGRAESSNELNDLLIIIHFSRFVPEFSAPQ